MTKEDFELVKLYVEKKIEFEIATREEDEEGYHGNAYNERKELDQAEKEILNQLT